mmetsp:Transcript_9747/g.27283  ORF Transcript_9747/g.27283 Transcript_9747/m.27283 type:complete len:253 (-) Transcript_9747:21-779(-)
MPTYVVTGASSGIGLDLVKALAARGEKVYATVRKRASSLSGTDAISQVPGDVTILEGIDVARDDVGAALQASALAGVTIDVIVHNAGSINGSRDVVSADIFPEQELLTVTMDRMCAAFEVNTLGPLRVQQALLPQMRTPGGKVAIISTSLGSISDGSGGIYAYRASKAAVNMVAKTMSCDLKAKEIAVQVITPGFLATEFGAGAEEAAKMGAKPVEQATQGIIRLLDKMSMDNTGSFMMVPTSGKAPKPFPW